MSNAIQQLSTELKARFPERVKVIDGSLAAVLASQHVLLLGPPGTGKSALVRALTQALGGTYFEHLMTKFTTPEEMFGPYSLKALEQDRYTRVTTGKLPEAHVAFVDEVFKANSAILNSLLTLMNERLFHNSGQPMKCPLVSMFGASNELPEGKELEALFDRFILRFEVDYLLQPANFRTVLTASDAPGAVTLTVDALTQAQAEVRNVTVTPATINALMAIRDACKAEGITASDRRWKQSLRLVQASAHLAGATETTPEDLGILSDSLWREPKERSVVARLVGKIADPISAQAADILDAALERSAKLAAIQQDAANRAAYISEAAKVLDALRADQKALTDLVKQGGRRAKDVITDAQQQLTQLQSELARSVSAGLGINPAAN